MKQCEDMLAIGFFIWVMLVVSLFANAAKAAEVGLECSFNGRNTRGEPIENYVFELFSNDELIETRAICSFVVPSPGKYKVRVLDTDTGLTSVPTHIILNGFQPDANPESVDSVNFNHNIGNE